jgi:hypothetical protein
METRYEYDITKIEGPDANIETSLKEYGIAWIEGPEDIIFYYGIQRDDTEYVQFDFCTIDKNLDLKKEYDWVDWNAFKSFVSADGQTDEDFWYVLHEVLPVTIQYLVSYYGYEEIFGSSYWEGVPYEGVFDRCYIERGEL